MPTGIQTQSDFFRTSDLALTTVISLSYSIEAVDRQNPRKAQFSFKRDDNLDELIEKYWHGSLRIEPQKFFNQLRVVKARLYGEE